MHNRANAFKNSSYTEQKVSFFKKHPVIWEQLHKIIFKTFKDFPYNLSKFSFNFVKHIISKSRFFKDMFENPPIGPTVHYIL